MPINNLMGALASSLAASCFVVNFIVYVTSLAEYGYPDLTGNMNEQIHFMMANQYFLQIWYAIIYLLFGICLTVLIIVLHQQQPQTNSLLVDLTNTLGLIWVSLLIICGLLITIAIAQIKSTYGQNESQAITLWIIIYTLFDGLTGSSKVIGGLWIMLTSINTKRQQLLKSRAYIIGLFSGATGLLTIALAPQAISTTFALSAAVWFGLIAIALLNQPNHSTR